MTEEKKSLKSKKKEVSALSVAVKILGAVLLVMLLFNLNKSKIEYYVRMSEPEEVYYTKAEYDYYYNSKLEELIDLDKVDIDKEKPLSVQFIKDDLSIDDYLKTYSLDKIRHNHAILSYIDKEDAVWFTEAGSNKKEEVNQAYKEYKDALEKEWLAISKDSKLSFEKFLKEKFGEDITEEVFEEVAIRNITADMYLKDRTNTAVSEEEIKEFYKENEDKFTAKKYMYYDLPFDNLEEKEEAEEQVLEMFDYIVDEESFVETIKTVDERVQKRIKEEGYLDEDILRDYSNIITINDNNNFTKEWLYSEDEKGEMVSPNSSAVLTSSIGENKDKGLYRIVYFVENVNDYKEVSWDFDRIFVSKQLEGEEVEDHVVEVLEKIDQVNSENYEEVFEEIIEEYGHNKADAHGDEYRYRNIKSSTLIDQGFINILNFLEDSNELEHTTIESEEGFVIIINKGKSIKSYKDEVEEYIKQLERDKLLEEIYQYAESYSLVAGKDKMPYLRINMEIYKENSSVEKVLSLKNEKEDEATEESIEEDNENEEDIDEEDKVDDIEEDVEDVENIQEDEGETEGDIEGEVEEGYEGEGQEEIDSDTEEE